VRIKADKDTFFHKKKTLRCGGRFIEFSGPAIMGILNLTPDSFYDGGKAETIDQALKLAEKMLNEGADFLDLGAVSTRPGAKRVPYKEERKRLIPLLRRIIREFPNALISVDTTDHTIAAEAINEGALIINDISGGIFDPMMFETVAKLGIPIIIMHMQGTPGNMQTDPKYKNVLKEVMFFLSSQLESARLAGISDIIIDPGFGFGKTVEHNYSLMEGLDLFKFFECPIMVGISRKSMINNVLGTQPFSALNGTTAVHTLALFKGADILRVHDVKEARQVVGIVKDDICSMNIENRTSKEFHFGFFDFVMFCTMIFSFSSC
jgi:dihydropteroate synthase